MVQAALGEYRKAEASYEKALAVWRESGNLFYQANLLNNYGFLKYQLGEYESAAQALEEGLLCARRSGYKQHGSADLDQHGRPVQRNRGLRDRRPELSQGADRLAQQLGDRFLINYLQIAEANLALLKREPAARTSNPGGGIQGAYEPTTRSTNTGTCSWRAAGWPCRRAMQSRLKSGLTEAKRYFTEDGREMECMWGSVWLASALGQRGRGCQSAGGNQDRLAEPESNQPFGRGRNTTGDGLARSPAAGTEMPGRRMRGLLDAADRLDDQLPAIRRQLRRMARTIEVPAPDADHPCLWPRPSVGQRHARSAASEWQTQAVRELFFYFLAMNKPVSKEQVGSVLWPDTTEPARLRLRFKNEMYRLRRAVGQETILYEDEYYQLNPAADHEYDVEAFEAYLARAKSSSLPAEQIRLYQQAIDLAGGEYLEDFGAVWVAPERERLHQEFVSAGLRLGELVLRGRPVRRQRCKVCERILEREPTSEAAYRLKMNIHRRLGDKAALVRTYRDCEERLQGVFGMPPSEETQVLYRKLVA